MIMKTDTHSKTLQRLVGLLRPILIFNSPIRSLKELPNVPLESFKVSSSIFNVPGGKGEGGLGYT